MNVVGLPLGPLAAVVGFIASLLAQLAGERRPRLGTAILTGALAGAAVILTARARMTGLTSRRRARHRNLPLWPSMSTVSARRGPPPPPTFADFQRVIPVGQTVTGTGVAVTIFSIESYADGFLVNWRVVLEQEEPLTPGRFRHPSPVLAARDERGRHYNCLPRGGSGNEREWRFSHGFSPALDPAAREVTVEITEIRLEERGPSRRPTPAETLRGPWRFSVALD